MSRSASPRSSPPAAHGGEDTILALQPHGLVLDDPPSLAPSKMQLLAPELLSEIFVRCLPIGDESAVPSSRTAPLNISQVSRRWRLIVLSTSGLWARLDITKPESCLRTAIPYLVRMDLWLSRSGKAPLEWKLHFCKPLPSENPSDRSPWVEYVYSFGYIVNALEGLHACWKDITIRCDDVFPSAKTNEEVLVALRGMPMLERLCLLFPCPGTGIDTQAKTTIDLSQSVLLKALSLQGNFVVATHGVVLEHLTRMKLKLIFNTPWRVSPGAYECFQLIECAPALEELRITYNYMSVPKPPYPSVTLRSLRELTLVDECEYGLGEATRYLCNVLALPALVRFSISCAKGGTQLDLPVLLQQCAAVETAEFNLQNDPEIFRSLRCLPGLSSLTMQRGNCGALVRGLTIRDGIEANENICLRIISFSFINCRFEADPLSLIQMIRSRWENHVNTHSELPLRISFRGCDLHGAEDDASVRACVGEGLDLDVGDRDKGMRQFLRFSICPVDSFHAETNGDAARS